MLCFLHIRYELSYDTFNTRSDRIYRVVTGDVASGDGWVKVSAPIPPLLKDEIPEIEEYARYAKITYNPKITVRYQDNVYNEDKFYMADQALLKIFDVDLISGSPEKVLSDKNSVAISKSIASKYFGDNDPIGKSIKVNNQFDFEVEAVYEDVPHNSHFDFDFLIAFENLEEIFPGTNGFSELRDKSTLIQQSPLLFDTTVEKNVDYGLRLRKVPKSERKKRVDQSLHFVNLDGFQKYRARKLSGGEAQRVAIARALSIDPEVIFLDEFSANIDSRHRDMVEKIIKEINHRFQTTIIFTTHYMDQAYRLSDNVIHLYKGRPMDTEVRNLFHGTIKNQDAENVFFNEKIRVCVDGAKEGPADILVPVNAITLSKKPLESSMRNCIQGKVSQIVDRDHLVLLKIMAGERFEASITKKSFDEMKLGPGSDVYLNFKATSVEIL